MSDLNKILLELANRNRDEKVSSWIGLSNSKKLIRKLAKAETYTSAPVKVVSGKSAPKLCGKSYYWTNKSGDIIHFPNAYASNWGKPIYNKSTRYISVGKSWLKKNMDITSIGSVFCNICNSPISDDEVVSAHGQKHIDASKISKLV